MTMAITRRERDAAGLRREAAGCRDAKAARRMLALALVLEGHSREEAARHAGGIHGLADIVLYETAGVARLAGKKPKTLLERRERASPAFEVHQARPEDGRHVQPCPLRMEVHEDSPENGERGEQEVSEQYRIGCDAIAHCLRPDLSPRCRRSGRTTGRR